MFSRSSERRSCTRQPFLSCEYGRPNAGRHHRPELRRETIGRCSIRDLLGCPSVNPSWSRVARCRHNVPAGRRCPLLCRFHRRRILGGACRLLSMLSKPGRVISPDPQNSELQKQTVLHRTSRRLREGSHPSSADGNQLQGPALHGNEAWESKSWWGGWQP